MLGAGGERVRSGELWPLLRFIGRSPCLSSYFPPWLWIRDLHFLPPLSILIYPLSSLPLSRMKESFLGGGAAAGTAAAGVCRRDAEVLNLLA